jgi:predicted adenine nucleotide alpha hydrolase (AANH) superfamily ATPase
MTQQAELIREIDKLPSKYIGEVLDYVEKKKKKAQNENIDDIEAYKAMAADTEREQEAGEWCSACFGPAYSKPVHPA